MVTTRVPQPRILDSDCIQGVFHFFLDFVCVRQIIDQRVPGDNSIYRNAYIWVAQLV
jgi:hypothetical protein